MAVAYGPNSEATDFTADLPVDWKTGEIKWAIYHAWNQHDPLYWIEEPEAQRALKNLDFLFVDAGNQDEYLLYLAARRFVARLVEYEISHTYEESDGGHRGTSYRYDISVPRMIRRFYSASHRSIGLG